MIMEEPLDRFTVDGIPCDAAFRNPVIDRIARHASVRAFDPGRPLPEGSLPVLVAAAQSASTASNFQTWSVVAIQDPGRKHTLREWCNDQAFIDEAPLLLVFCADISRLQWVTRRQGYPFNSNYMDLLITAVADAALAAQNAALAAESLGLGCCMVGAVRNYPRKVAELLNLPAGAFAVVGLAVGHPARSARVKPRLPQSVVLHQERYSTEGLEESVAAYDERLGPSALYKGRRVEVPGLTPDPEQDTGPYGWSEHTARRMALGKSLRRGLAGFLRERGFNLDE